MDTTQTMPIVGFNQHANTQASFIRLSISVIAGGIVTFGLFAAMHALIKQDMQRPPVTEPFIFTSSVLDIPEEKTVVRIKKEPPPSVQTKPVTPIIVPTEPPNNNSYTTVINIPKVGQDKLVVGVNAIDQQPRPMVRVDPRYPSQAASNGIEGYVTLSFSVSASGAVEDVTVLESQPRNTFDNAAKQALRKWRYQPKMVDGAAVGMDGLQVRLDFTLAKD